MWSITLVLRIQEWDGKDWTEMKRVWEILPGRWEEEGLKITVAIWEVELGCSVLDLEFTKARSWARCSDVNGNWGV